MSVKIEHIELPDRHLVMMPYAPAIKVTGGSLLFLAGVTRAGLPQPSHIAAEFENIPPDMESRPDGHENLKSRWRRRAAP
jgi:hypothetical protein